MIKTEANFDALIAFLKDEKIRPETIFELGARDCNETLAFSETFPNATIYSFECNPQTLPKCRQAVNSVGNINLIEKAVSEIDGQISFFQIDTEKTLTTWEDGNPGASSIFKASGKYPVEKYQQNEITVQSIRLDTFIGLGKIKNIDLIWMDLQGAELGALKSLGTFIQNVSVIHTEVEFIEIYSGQPLFEDIKDYLKSKGFMFVEFTSKTRFSADAIFINKKKISLYKQLKFLISKRFKNND